MLMHEQIPLLEQDIRVLKESLARLVSRVDALEAPKPVMPAAPRIIEHPKDADEPVKVAKKK